MSSDNRVVLGGRPFKPVEVELWGTLYNTRPVTRSLGEKTDEFYAKLGTVEDGDEVVEIIGGILDIYLVPSGGGRKKPSTLVVEKWKADKVSLPEINGLLADLTEAAERRPS